MMWHCEPPPGSQFPVLEVDAPSHARAVLALGRELDQHRPDLRSFAANYRVVLERMRQPDGWLQIMPTHYRHADGRLIFGSRVPERWQICASDGSPTGQVFTSLAAARAAT